MKEHVTITYEAFDGKMFDDRMACLDYELNELYKRSGIIFWDADWNAIDTLDDHAYNQAEFVTIHREKEKENKEFIDCVYDQFGWVLMREIYNDNHEKYKLSVSKAVPI